MTSAIERAVAAIGPKRFLGSLTTQEQQALAAPAAWRVADIPGAVTYVCPSFPGWSLTVRIRPE